MGLYDYINGEQVKVFYSPIYDEDSKNTWHSGGRMVGFDNGDEVPLKTLYFKRPSNFMVFDENSYDGKPLLHVIRDGKVYGTFDVENFDDNLFNDNDLVLTYYGQPINIKTSKDCYQYIRDYDTRYEKIREINKEYRDLLDNKLSPLGAIHGELGDNEVRNKIRPTKEEKLPLIIKSIKKMPDFEKITLDLFKCSSIELLEDLLRNDNELWELFKNTIQPIAKVMFHKTHDQMNVISENNKHLIKEVDLQFSEKWIPENKFKEEEEFGELLDCLLWAYSSKDDKPLKSLTAPMDRYVSVKNAIKEFILNTPGILDSYSKWQNLSNEEFEWLKAMSDFITNSKDTEFNDELFGSNVDRPNMNDVV